MKDETRKIYANKSNNYHKHNKTIVTDERISVKNKELISKWQDSLFAKGCQKYRVGKVTGQLLNLLRIAEYKDLNTFTVNDLVSIVSKINQHETWADAN